MEKCLLLSKFKGEVSYPCIQNRVTSEVAFGFVN